MSPGCYAPSLSPPLSLQTSQYSGWDEKEVGLFGSVLHSWGSWVLTHMFTLPPWEELQTKGLSLGIKLY